MADHGAVVVAPGVHRENIDFKGKAAELSSLGGPEETVIDGGGRVAAGVTFRSGEGLRFEYVLAYFLASAEFFNRASAS